MKRVVVLCFALFVSLGLSPAFAQTSTPAYLGLGYGLTTLDVDGFTEFDLDVLSLSGGIYFHKNFAAEARLGFGIGDDTYTDFVGDSLKVELDNYLGLYLRGEIPIEKLKLYGIVGFTRGEITGTFDIGGFGTFSESEDESDFSYGVGLDILPTDKLGLNLEYIQLMDKSDFDVTSLNFGVKFYFN